MIPFAVANQVHLSLVNRWDYPGSMPLLDAKLAELGSLGLEMRAKALAQLDLDMGISFVARTRGECPPSEH